MFPIDTDLSSDIRQNTVVTHQVLYAIHDVARKFVPNDANVHAVKSDASVAGLTRVAACLLSRDRAYVQSTNEGQRGHISETEPTRVS